jgi:D-glycero-D-manno-heptose 1,7-bisphosphate phosphatase
MTTRYLFDLDGTIVAPYMDRSDREFDAVELLPGVAERWKYLRWNTGDNLAIVSNQGGVAFGYQSEQQVTEKFRKVAVALGYDWIEVWSGGDTPLEMDSGATHAPGVLTFFVCYHDTRGQAPYNDPIQAARRKPSGAMIREAIATDPSDDVLFIGDRPEDEAAARDAGVDFQWAKDFFAAEVPT